MINMRPKLAPNETPVLRAARGGTKERGVHMLEMMPITTLSSSMGQTESPRLCRASWHSAHGSLDNVVRPMEWRRKPHAAGLQLAELVCPRAQAVHRNSRRTLPLVA
jgi:hypothetical protein